MKEIKNFQIDAEPKTYFFHTLSDVPVDEGTLGVHEIELVVCEFL